MRKNNGYALGQNMHYMSVFLPIYVQQSAETTEQLQRWQRKNVCGKTLPNKNAFI